MFVSGISSVNAISFSETLNLDIWNEIYDMNQYSINEVTFSNYNLKDSYTQIKYLDSKFKESVFQQYLDWKLKKYQVNAIVKEYKNFTYYANEFFHNLKQTEYWNTNSEIRYYIWSNYKELSKSYQRLKNISK